MQDELIRFDKTSKFLFLDFETEGLCLNHRFNKPWQMSLLKSVNGQKVGSQEVWIKWPKFKFSKGARMLAHSFSESKMEQDGISPKAALAILDKALSETDYLIGHNLLGFDVFIIKAMYEACGQKMPKLPTIIDTFPIAKGVINNLPYKAGEDFYFYQYKLINEIIKGSKTSLSALAKYYNIEIDEGRLHDATYDLSLNLAIWNKLKFQIQL